MKPDLIGLKMSTKFVVGDTVKSKAGGPVMTVFQVHESDRGSSKTCQWFAGKKLERGHFMDAELIHSDPPAPLAVPAA